MWLLERHWLLTPTFALAVHASFTVIASSRQPSTFTFRRLPLPSHGCVDGCRSQPCSSHPSSASPLANSRGLAARRAWSH
ncbi:hypothetical protein K437DRAFT_258633, partial [Tilletiaria anomala UBC 951]